MKPFTVQELQSLLAPHVAPCISIFLPTHCHHLGTGQATLEEIHAKVWPIVSELFRIRENEVLSKYIRLAGRGQATDDLHAVAQATIQGRVHQFLVAENVHL